MNASRNKSKGVGSYNPSGSTYRTGNPLILFMKTLRKKMRLMQKKNEKERTAVLCLLPFKKMEDKRQNTHTYGK